MRQLFSLLAYFRGMWNGRYDITRHPQQRTIELEMADGVPLKISKLLQEIRGQNHLHDIGEMKITKNHCRHVA
jgi:hypothetical protein